MNDTLTMEEISKYMSATEFEGVYRYDAPEGYEFWSCGTCYGSTIWGGRYLENHYYLKKI